MYTQFTVIIAVQVYNSMLLLQKYNWAQINSGMQQIHVQEMSS